MCPSQSILSEPRGFQFLAGCKFQVRGFLLISINGREWWLYISIDISILWFIYNPSLRTPVEFSWITRGLCLKRRYDDDRSLCLTPIFWRCYSSSLYLWWLDDAPCLCIMMKMTTFCFIFLCLFHGSLSNPKISSSRFMVWLLTWQSVVWIWLGLSVWHWKGRGLGRP